PAGLVSGDYIDIIQTRETDFISPLATSPARVWPLRCSRRSFTLFSAVWLPLDSAWNSLSNARAVRLVRALCLDNTPRSFAGAHQETVKFPSLMESRSRGRTVTGRHSSSARPSVACRLYPAGAG